MNVTTRINTAIFLCLFAPIAGWAENPLYPLKVSQNGRYFVDQNEAPAFWLGNTQWQLCRDVTVEDADTIINSVAGHGFTVVHVMLLGPGDGTKPNVHGESPWTSVDPLTPNEKFFKHVDEVVACTRKHNVVIALMPYHQSWRKLITEQNARSFAKWLAERYQDEPTVLWSLCPQQKPEYIPVLQELAAGLREGDGGKHLITIHPDPSPCTSSFLHNEPWLDFNSIQVWRELDLIYPMVKHDYELTPIKPVVMAEGAYEAGTEYKFDVTPLWVRRQAYYSYLLGSHHSYGHNDFWRNLPTWREKLDSPGAVQLGILKKFILARPEWWKLIPDQSILASGGITEGNVLNLAARHEDGRWGMVYLADKSTFSVDLSKLAIGDLVQPSWIDPRTGETVPLAKLRTNEVTEFSTPEGWEDALLLLE